MIKKLSILALIVGLFIGGAMGQNPCPGFHNPTSFTTPSTATGQWSARVGDRVRGSGGSTGSNVLSTCARPNKTPIKGNANITSSDYFSGYCTHRCGSCNHCTFYDGHDQRFKINLPENAGLDQFTINNGQGMQRIPAGHTSSIRLGDMRATGSCVNTINDNGNDKGAEAIFYTMKVTTQNSLLFIDYAVVACRYNHTPAEAGEFLIRVVGKNNATGQWNNFPLNDSMWFNVPAPAITGALPSPWVEGLPGGAAGATTCGYCYKPWARCAISLIDYLYDSVRVEMYTSDCIYNVDPIYAYIAGDCQPMKITSTGCPGGESNVIDTLYAPAGLISYTWYVSSEGYSGSTNNTSYMNTLPFRQLTPTQESNIYVATTNDFIVTQGPHAGDTVPVQTFKCVMTSAMDPEKPFHSVVYASVSNTKPVISATITPNCDSTVDFHADYYIPYEGPGVASIVDSLTTWTIFEGSTNDTPIIGEVYGRDTSFKFSDQNIHAVRLSVYTEDSSCYTSRTYIFTPTLPPDIHISIDKPTLCVGEDATITDLTENVQERTWYFADSTIHNSATVVRHFSNFENPFYIVVTSTNGCIDTLWDTIYFFHDPEITFSEDTIICNGHESHVTASTPVAGCTFAWFRHKDQPGETPINEGNTLYVRPTQAHTRYYLRVTASAGCVAWDSVDLSLISTKIVAQPSHAKHCPGDTVALTGHGALRYEWTSYPPDPNLEWQAHNQTIYVSPNEDTRYYMVGYAADDCDVAAISILVKYVPLPEIDLEYTPQFIDTEVPIVNFTDLSTNRDHTRWLFGDGASSTGEKVTHHFDIYAPECNVVTMQTYNEIGCSVDSTFTIPIDTFGFYRPNVFTPNKSTNNRFYIVCPSQLDKFHIDIFNRRGHLVFSSDDQHFQWDGTNNGNPLPQESYPYIITYTRSGYISEYKVSGIVTLIR